MNVRKVVCAAVAMLVMLAASVNGKPEPKPEAKPMGGYSMKG